MGGHAIESCDDTCPANLKRRLESALSEVDDEEAVEEDGDSEDATDDGDDGADVEEEDEEGEAAQETSDEEAALVDGAEDSEAAVLSSSDTSTSLPVTNIPVGVWIGVGIGGAVFLALAATLIVVAVKRHVKAREQNAAREFMHTVHSASPPSTEYATLN